MCGPKAADSEGQGRHAGAAPTSEHTSLFLPSNLGVIFATLREQLAYSFHLPSGNLLIISLPLPLRVRNAIYNCARRNRSALPITETELKLMAAAAIIGLSSRPMTGYKIPAAIGTPSAL